MLIGGASALFWIVSGVFGVDTPRPRATAFLSAAPLPHGCFFALGTLPAKTDGRRLRRRPIAGIAVMLLACGIEIAASA